VCAGIIGYRCLRLTGISDDEWNRAKLGLYGCGAAGHVCIQVGLGFTDRSRTVCITRLGSLLMTAHAPLHGLVSLTRLNLKCRLLSDVRFADFSGRLGATQK